MTQDLETVMKNALDGKFYSFFNNRCGELTVIEKSVKANHVPQYDFENRNIENRGRWARAEWMAKRRQKMWTTERLFKLKEYHSLGYGAKKIERAMRLGRVEIEMQLNKMGLLNRKGTPYK
jgi:hypothetical protein